MGCACGEIGGEHEGAFITSFDPGTLSSLHCIEQGGHSNSVVLAQSRSVSNGSTSTMLASSRAVESPTSLISRHLPVTSISTQRLERALTAATSSSRAQSIASNQPRSSGSRGLRRHGGAPDRRLSANSTGGGPAQSAGMWPTRRGGQSAVARFPTGSRWRIRWPPGSKCTGDVTCCEPLSPAN